MSYWVYGVFLIAAHFPKKGREEFRRELEVTPSHVPARRSNDSLPVCKTTPACRPWGGRLWARAPAGCATSGVEEARGVHCGPIVLRPNPKLRRLNVHQRARNTILAAMCFVLLGSTGAAVAAPAEQLVHHEIKTDAHGYILPWYSPDPGVAYDHCIMKVWEFWKNMKSCPNGVKYYLQHQVWQDPGEDPRGLGGDQLAMALSSWHLLYEYSGDLSIIENMEYIADYYLTHSLSKPECRWPGLPYPYNTDLHSGAYDGDMRAGKGYLQPDKAGSFAAELVTLYKLTGEGKYLRSAVSVADVLARRISPGDAEHSPWPYRVNATTGEVSLPYTTNYTGTLQLFEGLINLKQGDVAAYAAARATLSGWLKKYPLRNNKWGPFFEDVPGWSDTEINADTMATYIMEHPDWDPNWREDARAILAWTQTMFENDAWLKYGVRATNEQTAYPVPGNSHSSRHASVMLIYAEKTGDATNKPDAIRELNWATYMVGEAGNNRYPYDDVWLTDGYGDYVRHYLRAMAAAPELAPSGQDHLLRSSSVVKRIAYAPRHIAYTTFDDAARELLRVAFAPTQVRAGGTRLVRVEAVADLDRQEGYTFNAPGDVPGVLRIRHDSSGEVTITGESVPQPPVARSQTVTVNQNSSARITLGAQGAGGTPLTYSVTGPYHGKLTGVAPQLTYTPDADYLGCDLLSFRARDGGLESGIAQVTIQVVRPNLARLTDAQPFATEDPRTGATGLFPLPALADGDVTTSVDAAYDRASPREVSFGVLWNAPQSIRQVVFRQGMASEKGGGNVDGPPRLQVTTDGTNWSDASGWTMSPGLYAADARSSMGDFIFTFSSSVRVKGVRIAGKVGDAGAARSRFPRVREFEVYSALASSRAPEIEYQPGSAVVKEGGMAIFGVRPKAMSQAVYQWQKSTDQGAQWENLPGENSGYYRILSTRAADSGTMFRCVVSNGTAPDAVSKAAKLTVNR